MNTPFLFGHVTKERNFTDREKETERLVINMRSGINTALISPRRWGKSSLVHHAALIAKERDPKLRVCFIDLFNTRTEEDFYQAFAQSVINATSDRWDEFVTKAKGLFKQLMPKFSMSLDPNSEISINLDWKEVSREPEDILDLAERMAVMQGVRMVVCIDEFQNLREFDDPLAFQRQLRARWQHHSNVTYILYGSLRHMLIEVFSSPSMPFYKFGDIIFLEKIALKDWVPFIVQRFRDTDKDIPEKVAAFIANAVECHPHYVQQLAQLTWLRTDGTCSLAEAEEALTSLIMQLSMLFQTMTDALTRQQVNLLKAILSNEESLTSHDTVQRYALGAASSVSRSKEALVQKEVLDTIGDRIEFIDPVYKLWLLRYYFRLTPLPQNP